MMKKVCIINSGCEGHFTLFRQILESAENYESTRYPDEADVIIHFACGFSEKEMTEIFNYVVYYEKLKKPTAKLVFCGCALTGYRKEVFEEFRIVDYVLFGMNILPKIAQIMGVSITDNQYYENDDGLFCIKIAEGCYKPGKFCSFCKQNYLKIPYKSNYSIERIVELIKAQGKPIVSLQAMNSTNYGIDCGEHKPKLHTLIHQVSRIETVKWIQVIGVASSCIYEELVNEIERNEKVFNVQFYIQSGSDHMLKIMNIGSTIADNTRVLERFRKKTVSGGVVVGHPEETMEDVLKTIQFIKDHNLWYIDVMRYKDSVMTPSGNMEKLSKEEYEAHCEMVEEAVNKIAYQNMRNIEEQGFTGFISEFYNKDGRKKAKVIALHFMGGCYVEVNNMKINLGDTVFVQSPRIQNVKHHTFIGETVEVLK